MTDRVRSAIARNLGVSEHSIALWRITVGSGSRSSGGRACPTMIEAGLEVKLLLDREDLQKLGEKLRSDRPTSLRVQQFSPVVTIGENTGQIFVDVTLLHGKETQHLFKALHQTMTVRGRQGRKKR